MFKKTNNNRNNVRINYFDDFSDVCNVEMQSLTMTETKTDTEPKPDTEPEQEEQILIDLDMSGQSKLNVKSDVKTESDIKTKTVHVVNDTMIITPKETEIINRIYPVSHTQDVFRITVDKNLQDKMQVHQDLANLNIKNNISESNGGIQKLLIRSSNNQFVITKNMIKVTKPILTSFSGGVLKIWNADFTENRLMSMDGSTIVNGYNVRDFDDSVVKVNNKINIMEVMINLGNLKEIDFQGDSSNIIFEDGVFNNLNNINNINNINKNIVVKARGYSKISLGSSNVNIIRDVLLTTVQ